MGHNHGFRNCISQLVGRCTTLPDRHHVHQPPVATSRSLRGHQLDKVHSRLALKVHSTIEYNIGRGLSGRLISEAWVPAKRGSVHLQKRKVQGSCFLISIMVGFHGAWYYKSSGAFKDSDGPKSEGTICTGIFNTTGVDKDLISRNYPGVDLGISRPRRPNFAVPSDLRQRVVDLPR